MHLLKPIQANAGKKKKKILAGGVKTLFFLNADCKNWLRCFLALLYAHRWGTRPYGSKHVYLLT